MSMWRIGRESVRIGEPVLTPLDRSVAYTRAATDGTGGPLGDIADTVAKWIPGEVLALYVAGVTMIGTPNVFWLVIGILLAPLVVVLAAYANSGKLPTDQRIQGRATLALVAMLLWTLVVPNSGWWSWDVIGNNPEAVALAGGALGLIFGLVAEGTARWLDAQAARTPVSAPSNAWAPAYQPEPVAAEPGQPMRETTEPVVLPEDQPQPPGDDDPTDVVRTEGVAAGEGTAEPKRRRRPMPFRSGSSEPGSSEPGSSESRSSESRSSEPRSSESRSSESRSSEPGSSE